MSDGYASGMGGDGGAGIGSGRHGADAGSLTTSAPVSQDPNAYSWNSVEAYGGDGAAGIGGGLGGDGGSVVLDGQGSYTAQQGADVGTPSASAVGIGEGGAVPGSLRIGSDARLQIYRGGVLRVPAGQTVQNAGVIDLQGAIAGAGTVANTGSIVTPAGGWWESPDFPLLPPDTRVGSDLTVTGHNYLVTVDPNGGTLQGATTAHLWSSTVSGSERDLPEPTAPHDGQIRLSWNTAADGSGDNADYRSLEELAHATSTDGTPVPLRLFARYGRPASFTGPELPDAALGAAYDQALPFSGESISLYVDQWDDRGTAIPGLPAGLQLSSDRTRVTGAPTAPGTYHFTIEASGPRNRVTHEFTLIVAGPPVIATDALADGTAGAPYSSTIAATGVGPIAYEVGSGRLPAGLTLDRTTGALTGTPTASGAAAFVVRATSRFGLSLAPLTMTIGAAASTVPSPATSTPVSTTSPAAPRPATPDAAAPTTTTSTSTTSPAAPTSSAGAHPTTTSTTSASASPAAPTSSVTSTAPVPAAPVLPGIDRRTVRFGHPLSVAAAANSTLPVTYSITKGDLPRGVSLDARTGTISGVPAEVGTFTAEVTARSSAGSATTSVVVEVPPIEELISSKPAAATALRTAPVPVTVRGLQKGERWQVRLDGKVVASGTMRNAGTLSTTVQLKKASRDTVHRIVVTGLRTPTDPAKRATTSFRVTSLAASKRLTAGVGSASNGRRTVKIGRLAAGEAVVVSVGRKVVAEGHATRSGSFTFSARTPKSSATKLTVHGATAKRATTVKVKSAKH